jgi:putative ABC transport system permease protein
MGPPIRAAARIAWRQAKRSPWRSALVAAMVTLPIMALSGTAIAIKTVIPTPRELVAEAMGTADIVIQGWSEELRPKDLERELPRGTRVVAASSLYSQNIVRGSTVYLSMREFSTPVDRPPLRGMFVILDGRAPVRAGEAALPPSALSAFGAHVGDEIHLDDLNLTLRVTGTAIPPGRIGDHLALLGPGTVAGKADVGIDGFWIDLPPGISLDRATAILAKDPKVQGYQTSLDAARMDQGAAAVANGSAFAAGAVALFGTGLIVAAAFVMGFRRQLRMLGLVGAQGAAPRHVRAIVLFGGVSLGFVGSCAGVVLGIAGSFAFHPYLSRVAGRLVGPVALPILPLIGSIALGTAAATIAALGPARSAARLSTLDALAGRTQPPRKPGRIAGGGLVALAVGIPLTAWSTIGHVTVALAAGLLLTVGGFLVAIPLLVTWVGRLSGHLPTIPRLAARDLARNGRRTGAALAAATIALALPVAISSMTLSDEVELVPFMAKDQLSVSLSAPGGHLQRRGQALVADLRAVAPSSLIVPLVPAKLAAGESASAGRGASEAVVLGLGGTETIQPGMSYQRQGNLWIGGPDLLRAFHAEAGIPALDAGTVVAIGPRSTDHGVVHLVIEDQEGYRNGERPIADVTALEAGATRYASLSNTGEYNYVISPAGAARLGLVPTIPSDQNLQFVLLAPRPLSKGEIERVKSVAARHPGAFVISPGDLGSHGGPFRWIISAAGTAVALAILAVVLALVAAESRRDRAILVAVGAGPRARRKLAAVDGLLIAVLAGLLAIPVGFTPAVVYEVSQRIGNPIVIPWAAIALILVGVPLLAAALAGLASRQPDAARLLRPLA